MKCEESQQELWKAGEIVPAGTYTRVDDHSYHLVLQEHKGPQPAKFDGPIAPPCSSACRCATHTRKTEETEVVQ